jgi:hypothetical protein
VKHNSYKKNYSTGSKKFYSQLQKVYFLSARQARAFGKFIVGSHNGSQTSHILTDGTKAKSTKLGSNTLLLELALPSPLSSQSVFQVAARRMAYGNVCRMQGEDHNYTIVIVKLTGRDRLEEWETDGRIMCVLKGDLHK